MQLAVSRSRDRCIGADQQVSTPAGVVHFSSTDGISAVCTVIASVGSWASIGTYVNVVACSTVRDGFVDGSSCTVMVSVVSCTLWIVISVWAFGGGQVCLICVISRLVLLLAKFHRFRKQIRKWLSQVRHVVCRSKERSWESVVAVATSNPYSSQYSLLAWILSMQSHLY